jgi:hypothetical protein
MHNINSINNIYLQKEKKVFTKNSLFNYFIILLIKLRNSIPKSICFSIIIIDKIFRTI